ncbi:MAG: peroxiredoxin, partial [Spirochaetia bacterium]|nr:peroxiredoxin [Spirochaetia bacterium]
MKRPIVGDLAPDFILPSTKAGTFQLKKQLEAGPLVLFFYPKDFTGGCTAESCSFRDHHAAFARKGVSVFGVSRDDIPTHERFIKAHSLPYDLLSDPDARVHTLYGLKKR